MDTHKVLATVKPTSFRQLMLLPLDQPIRSTPATASRRRGAELNALEHLLDAMSAERPQARDVTATARPGREWATVKVPVRIEEPGSS
jgi:hypothetical protein